MSQPIPVRATGVTDLSVLQAVIRGCGLFSPEEAEGFARTLYGHFEIEAGSSGEERLWLLADEGAGAAYLAPEPGPGVWNLLFLGVRPEARRRGVARALVAEIERRLRQQGARMLLIDTSTEPAQAAARTLYDGLGYERVALIPEYWGPGDGKVTFRRVL